MFHRIYAMIVRNMMLTFRGVDPLIDVFYWPLFDLVLWGLTSKVVQVCGGQNIPLIWLAGLVLWQACWRSNLDISFNLLSELWSRNVVNLFATPIELYEWIIASMALGAIDACVSILFGIGVVYVLYGVNVFAIGWLFIPLFFLLLFSGWALGFFTAGWIVYSGQKLQKLVWVLGWIFVPFSALFIPLSVLPPFALAISKALPMSYAFEVLRVYVTHGTVLYSYLGISLLLNCVYLTLSLLFFKMMFTRSKSNGLARLDSE